MDFSGALGNLNWWAVLVSIGVVMLVGSLWYANFLFGKAWIAAVGKTRIELQQGRSMLWLMLTTVFWTSALVLTIALLEQFIGINTWQDGLILGLLLGFGVSVATGNVHALFENRFNSLVWITSGHNVLMCVIPAVILAVWQ
jgi:Protein of unknown function (DUF1761)